MTVAERALKVKFNLWEIFGVDKGLITGEILLQAICATGLSKKSRGIKAVIYYLMDYRHLGKSDGYYYVIYKKKDQAKPRDIIVRGEKELRDNFILRPDISHKINDYAIDVSCKSCYLNLMTFVIEYADEIRDCITNKGSCLVKFERV